MGRRLLAAALAAVLAAGPGVGVAAHSTVHAGGHFLPRVGPGENPVTESFVQGSSKLEVPLWLQTSKPSRSGAEGLAKGVESQCRLLTIIFVFFTLARWGCIWYPRMSQVGSFLSSARCAGLTTRSTARE